MNNNINIKKTYLVIIVTVLSLLITVLFKLPIFLGLFSSLIYTSIISYKTGYSLKKILYMIFEGMKKSIVILVLMSLIGMLIGIWMSSSTVPTLIYYGFKYLINSNIILAAFIASSIVSMIMGTAFGTISTIGTVFISLAVGMGVPLAPITGAIVSGSFFGDRTSPLSGSMNLNAGITNTDVLDNIKHMNLTTFPAYIISAILYWVIGNNYIGNISGLAEIEHLSSLLTSNFHISLISLLSPMLILICAVIFKLPIIKSISVGLVTSILIFLFRDVASISTTLKIMILGYHSENAEISKIISGGGFVSMKNVLLIISLSTGLNGILDGTGMITPLIGKFSKNIKTKRNLIYKTALLCMTLTIITCNQSLAVLIPGLYLKGIYDKFNISRNTLSRTIADVGVLIVPLIPWNINAIFVTSITHVPTMEYLPYSFLCFIPTIITFIYPIFKYPNDIKL